MSHFYAAYGDSELEIVRKGIPAIRSVLLGEDTQKQKNLLLALDWFMDPFYKQDISKIYDELLDILQTVVIFAEDHDVAEDAFGLLSDYAWPPFTIIEQNLDQVFEERRHLIQTLMEQDAE